MKNKTSRAKSMKLKKAIAASLAISILFSFTGCGTYLVLQQLKAQNRKILPQQLQALRLIRMKS